MVLVYRFSDVTSNVSLNGAIRGRPYAAWMHVFAIVDDKKVVYVKVFLNGPIRSLAKSLTSVGGRALPP